MTWRAVVTGFVNGRCGVDETAHLHQEVSRLNLHNDMKAETKTTIILINGVKSVMSGEEATGPKDSLNPNVVRHQRSTGGNGEAPQGEHRTRFEHMLF